VEGDNNGQDEDIGEEGSEQVPSGGESVEGRSGVMMNMSLEEILQHPLVLKMIQCLEALEGIQTARECSANPKDTEKVTSEKANDQGEGMQQQVSLHKLYI